MSDKNAEQNDDTEGQMPWGRGVQETDDESRRIVEPDDAEGQRYKKAAVEPGDDTEGQRYKKAAVEPGDDTEGQGSKRA